MLDHCIVFVYHRESDWVEQHDPREDIPLSKDSTAELLGQGDEVTGLADTARERQADQG